MTNLAPIKRLVRIALPNLGGKISYKRPAKIGTSLNKKKERFFYKFWKEF